MSEEQPQRPTTDDRAAWHAYWQVQGMQWRTEPEIDAERQQFLAERRNIKPDIDKGIYPFRDENGSIKLTRADVEWLVATYDVGAPLQDEDRLVLVYSAGPSGPPWVRQGPDLRGADLRGVDLAGMQLVYARMDDTVLAAARLDTAMLEGATLIRANCAGVSLRGAHLDSTDLREANLQDADLSGASLVQAWLRQADLQRANLRGANFDMASMELANLAGADLTGAHLTEVLMAGADLRGSHLDRDATMWLLGGTIIGRRPVELPFLEWTALPLAAIDWERVFRLAEWSIQHIQDIQAGRTVTVLPAGRDPEAELVKTYRALARNYRRLADIWQEQGLDEYADRLRRRGDVMREDVVKRQAGPDEGEPDQDELDEDVPI